MAKKSKKQVRKVSGSARSSGARTALESNGTTAQTSTTVSMTSRLSGPEFKPDYSTTIKDLKRIGTLAGTFFVVLVIISFFLR